MKEIFNFATRDWESPSYENKITKTAFKVLKQDNILYVAFRYTTESWLDWLWNLFAWKSFNVHSGFLASYLSIYFPLRRRIRSFEPFDKIIFVGFSKGGALAQIANSKNYFSSESISFANPRWAGKNIEYNKKAVSCQVGGDVVCRLPFKFFGYQDIGEIRKIDWKWYPSFKAHKPSTYRNSLVNKV